MTTPTDDDRRRACAATHEHYDHGSINLPQGYYIICDKVAALLAEEREELRNEYEPYTEALSTVTRERDEAVKRAEEAEKQCTALALWIETQAKPALADRDALVGLVKSVVRSPGRAWLDENGLVMHFDVELDRALWDAIKARAKEAR